jgi:hypothetical protein
MGVALLKNTYVPDRDNHLRYSDVVAAEVAATGGYTAGGKQVANRAASYDPAADEYNLQGDDVVWGPGATITARYAVVYEMATADKYLWALLDFGADQTVSSGYFSVDFIAGVLSVKAGPPV